MPVTSRARPTGFSHRVGAPWSTLLRPFFALPRPDALSPPPLCPPRRAHNTLRVSILRLEYLTLSGWGYASPQAKRLRPVSMMNSSPLK
jgi:hypothetical protein